ncbi:MAG: hypothetical protein G3M70_07150 [Candidatus Nitronauta litoralis]|uniref:DnaA N-terminal domain-containing protein n=1 Tax=Candidatus Nitronauta litoralis TaxID=2705533 RepID=A0A7T0BVJ7_9BACT|nr:MAG: hypothetical protein G3M70_07150 [Candidatus Nitronauta litoralis]
MILRCPTCGTTASFETWGNQDVQGCLKLFSEFPKPTPHSAVHYLTLFRPAKTVLTWKKAGKVLKELLEMIDSKTIKIPGEPEIGITPATWAKAMDSMVLNDSKIKRPLTNHNYLKKVAYSMADEVDQNPPCKGGKRSQGDYSNQPEQEESDLPTPDDYDFFQLWIEKCADEIPAESVSKYFLPLELAKLTDMEMTIKAPNDLMRKLLNANFKEQMEDAMKKLDGPARTLRILADPKGGTPYA